MGNNVRRKDIKGVPVVELDKDQVITAETISIPYDAVDEDGFQVTSKMACPPSSPKKFTVSTDKKFVACCLPTEILAGSSDTEFRCCAKSHYLAHSEETGSYSCCPEGQAFDGTSCYVKDPPVEMCKNGKKMVDGTCVCPGETVEEGGECKSQDIKQDTDKDDIKDKGKDKAKPCSSDVNFGKCYQIIINGNLFGSLGDTSYGAFPPDADFLPGRFQFCKDADCKSEGPINPGEGFYIKDIHGIRRSGLRSNEWLNNFSEGNHILKTPEFEHAGQFTVTKWPCGRYCLGGFDKGLGPACPTKTPALSFYSYDKQACQPVTLQGVPCDNHAGENSCLWGGREQCCGDEMNCKGGFVSA